ncbi:MAG TPA: radical SAM protein [Chthonomonadaceae bacterium]|nr:radical SAM protein [Chthonomonadaceae bacterium]
MQADIPLLTARPTRPAGKRRKVVLYNPQAVFFTMPLALLAIGSHLDPARYEVVIVDARLEADPVAAVRAHLDDALCLGVTVLTGAPIRDAVRISRAARACRPDLPIVWGGWHPSMFGKECLLEPAVDITVQAQGEETFAEILERLENGETMEGCLGCAYRTPDGDIHANPPRPLRNVNTFRPHNYDLLPVERYYELKGKPQIDYISSQGCAFRCAFCADPFVYGRKWVGLTPERMGEEIEALWRRYRFNDVNFQDETFFTYVNRVEGIAEEFLRRELPITWAGTMRADQGARLPEEVLAWCKRSGLRRVIIGVESGSQEMMNWIKKDIKLEQVFISAEKCLKYDIAVNFPFIVGFPNETEESVQASLDVAKKLRAMSPKFVTPFFYFKPYPGTSITEQAVKEGFALPCSLEEWSTFDFVGSVGGPWVSPEKYRRIERFKFYQQVAWDVPKWWRRPMQKVAQWRCRHDFYAFPVEKTISHWLRPPQRLS